MNVKPLVASLLLAVACADADAPKPVSPTPAAPAPSAGTNTTAANVPNPHAANAGADKHHEYSFTVPEGWVAETPGMMKKLQFKLPRHGNDTEDAQVWVSVAGGSREMNLARWHGEFTQPDGKDTKDVAKTSTRKVNGVDVFEYDVRGTCVAGSGGMGGAQTAPKENWRQIVSSIGDGNEQWFVKIRGPVATVDHWEASYRKYVESLKADS